MALMRVFHAYLSITMHKLRASSFHSTVLEDRVFVRGAEETGQEVKGTGEEETKKEE